MIQYAYAYLFEHEGDEVFLDFPRIPSIIASLSKSEFEAMSAANVQAFAHDAVVSALQGFITTRDDIPEVDDARLIQADGFVRLSTQEAMKLELFKLYQANCNSLAEFARRLGKPETPVRRLLDLRHASRTQEIEGAIGLMGKQLVHSWDLEVV